jgi:hypothetical protein
MIRQLPDGCALIVRGGLSPVIARLPMAWKDPAYKRARRAGRAIAALAAVPDTAPTIVPRPQPWLLTERERELGRSSPLPGSAPTTSTTRGIRSSQVTMAENPAEGLVAALVQISAHAERIAVLDAREAGHYREIAARLRELASEAAALSTRIDDLGGTVSDQAAILASLDGLDEQVAVLAGQIAENAPGDDAGDGTAIYRPIPPPRWWNLTGDEREAAIARLRAWVEQIFRPSYGRLSAMLAPCWEQHPLCVFMLDWPSELWSVLYLTPRRTGGSLGAQGEWQTRLLPAAAEQMYAETSGCEHVAGSHGHGPSITTRLNRP